MSPTEPVPQNLSLLNKLFPSSKYTKQLHHPVAKMDTSDDDDDSAAIKSPEEVGDNDSIIDDIDHYLEHIQELQRSETACLDNLGQLLGQHESLIRQLMELQAAQERHIDSSELVWRYDLRQLLGQYESQVRQLKELQVIQAQHVTNVLDLTRQERERAEYFRGRNRTRISQATELNFQLRQDLGFHHYLNAERVTAAVARHITRLEAMSTRSLVSLGLRPRTRNTTDVPSTTFLRRIENRGFRIGTTFDNAISQIVERIARLTWSSPAATTLDTSTAPAAPAAAVTSTTVTATAETLPSTNFCVGDTVRFFSARTTDGGIGTIIGITGAQNPFLRIRRIGGNHDGEEVKRRAASVNYHLTRNANLRTTT